MRKLIVEFMLFFLAITYMYAGYTVAVSGSSTYYSVPNVSKTDLVEIFLEELDKENYAYGVVDYEAITDLKGDWKIDIVDNGYTYENGSLIGNPKTKVYERSVYLRIKNGYIAFRFFSEPTTIRNGLKSTIDFNNSSSAKINLMVTDCYKRFLQESFRWMKRNNLQNFSSEEITALDLLTGSWAVFADKRTVLMLMAEQNEETVVKSLLNKNLNEQDKDGWTALMYAASKNSLEAAKILLDAGADFSIKNNKGQTALSIASGKNFTEMTKILQNKAREEKEREELRVKQEQEEKERKRIQEQGRKRIKEKYHPYYDKLLEKMKG